MSGLDSAMIINTSPSSVCLAEPESEKKKMTTDPE